MPQPYSWARIVRASTKLSPSAKLVWDELRLLDSGPDGAYPRPDVLAQRLGMDVRTVERVRQDLVRADLLRSERRGQRWHWYVRLPEFCEPSQRPTNEEVHRFAVLLDAFLGNYAETRTQGT